jgi:hypothetical protein
MWLFSIATFNRKNFTRAGTAVLRAGFFILKSRLKMAKNRINSDIALAITNE